MLADLLEDPTGTGLQPSDGPLGSTPFVMPSTAPGPSTATATAPGRSRDVEATDHPLPQRHSTVGKRMLFAQT